MNRIQHEQQRRNQQTRACWELYAEHRRRVTDLLVGYDPEAAPTIGNEAPTSRLCVLGAGNCNDLDLPQLLTRFGEIHLVDLDAEALSAGVGAQRLDADPRVALHPGVDVIGLSGRLSFWSCDRPPPLAEIDAMLAAVAGDGPGPLEGSFDAVASVCLLSQLLEPIKLALGETHCQYLPLVQAVRTRHLRQVVNLCRPGGHLVLVTDFVSSDTCPELATVADGQLPALAEQLVSSQNFFTGLNPFLLKHMFASDPWLTRRVRDARLSRPWRWHFPARFYAVCAITAIRRRFDSGD